MKRSTDYKCAAVAVVISIICAAVAVANLWYFRDFFDAPQRSAMALFILISAVGIYSGCEIMRDEAKKDKSKKQRNEN